MLDPLCGNRTVQKILLFLFINGKGYGNQISRLLKASLTPLQKSLSRLEKGGVLMSSFEGKTKVYQFNPAYPLLPELESLLKKAYMLLPCPEKKSYSLTWPKHEEGKYPLSEANKILLEFWQRLQKVKHLTFQSSTKAKKDTGWSGRGKGSVVVTQESDNVLVFQEEGHWQGAEQNPTAFSNAYRWTLDRSAGMLSLEHLRRGPNHPVFLFHLVPCSKNSLSSLDSHLCESDLYFGRIFFDRHSLRLHWRILGPKKDEEIDCYYI